MIIHIFIVMDYKFLDKVLDQIIYETEIDYDRKVIGNPFPFPLVFYPHFSLSSRLIPHYFSHHCKNIYGLNKQEIEYVWEEYRNIIKDKINNGL
jgi:hypothetical protein